MRQSRNNPLDSRTRRSMTKSKRFDLKLFSRLFSKNRHPGKLQFTLSPERLSWLFLLWEVKPSPDCKLIKHRTFLFFFLLLSTFLLKPDLSWTTVLLFPYKMTLVYERAPLRLFSVFFLLVFENWNQHLIYFYREFLVGLLLFALTTFIAPVGLLLIRTDMRRSSTVSATEDHVLKGHTIHKQHTYAFLSCAQLCLAHQSCMSFNYQSIENGVCELNREVSPASISVALTSKRGYTFGHFVDISVSIIYSFTVLFT